MRTPPWQEAAQVIAGKERELTVAQAKLEAFDEESLRAEAQEAHAQQRAAKARHSEVENRKRVLVRAMDRVCHEVAASVPGRCPVHCRRVVVLFFDDTRR